MNFQQLNDLITRFHFCLIIICLKIESLGFD
jgi:hypothetical protein